jgi:hypothetical protein
MSVSLVLYCSSPSDSYTSLKLVRQRHLLSRIQTINNKKVKSLQDNAELEKLQKELKPIEKFLGEARQHRDAILVEIGMVGLVLSSSLLDLLMFSQLGNRLREMYYHC